ISRFLVELHLRHGDTQREAAVDVCFHPLLPNRRGDTSPPPLRPRAAIELAHLPGPSVLFGLTMGLQPATAPERAVARPRGVPPRLTRLLAPESWRPDPRLALRGILGLMVPVVVGRALDLSGLDLVGIAAFLLTFGDVTGSEQPRQLIRLGIGTVLGATALAGGVIAGSHTGAAPAGI